MNKLDILPQNAPRRAEVPAGKASNASHDGGREGKVPSRGDAFGSLLKALKSETAGGRRTDGPAAASQADPDVASQIESSIQASRNAGDDETDGPDGTLDDLLRALASRGESGQGPAVPTGAEAGSVGATLAALERLLPKLFAQNSSSGAQGQARTSPSHPSSLSALAAAGLLNPASEGGLKIAVLHQETHFKPVIEGLTSQLVSQESGDAQPPIGTKATDVSPAVGMSKNAGTAMSSSGLSAALPPAGAGTPSAGGSQDPSLMAEDPAVKGATNQVGPALQSESTAPRSDAPASLPVAMLQRIGAAVIAEAGSLSAGFESALQGAEPAAPRTVIKASEGAVRVLDIQLHPAELGAVTVRMRLSGEHLEMQLHASNEETARLLKNDSEKISALLRGAGYRPDIVSVHTGSADAGSMNGASPPRSHSFGQAPQNGSPQGGSGQQGHAAHQDGRQETGRKGGQNDGQMEDRSPARSLGGIYL